MITAGAAPGFFPPTWGRETKVHLPENRTRARYRMAARARPGPGPCGWADADGMNRQAGVRAVAHVGSGNP
jgi:hypothetical protein